MPRTQKPRFELKVQLRQPKNNKTIANYLLDIKKIVDTLLAVGSPITTEDHIEAILDGLPEEFDGFVTSLTSRLDPYTVEDVEALLLAQEERLEKHRLQEQHMVQAHMTSTSDDHSRISSRPPSNSFRGGRFRFTRGGRSSSRNPSRHNNTYTTTRVQCQICGKNGHSTVDCWHRYDQGSSPQINANSAQFFSTEDTTSSILGAPSTINDPIWYPDSGATHHITNDVNNYTKKQAFNGNDVVKLGNGAGMNIRHVGTACYQLTHTQSPIFLHNLLHVPEITKNLMSVSKCAQDNNVFFEFHANKCFVKHQATKEIILQGNVKDGLYVFPSLKNINMCSVNTTTCNSVQSPFSLWHSRLGHVSMAVVKRVLTDCNITCNKQSFMCDSCIVAKAHQIPFSTSNIVYDTPLQLVYIDIWGPAPINATCGARYYISFLDAFTRYTWLYLINTKSQALAVFKLFKTFAENQTGHKLKSIQTDNAKEFLCFNSILCEYGIHHRLTCPYTHEQNGSIERKHRHIVDVRLSMLAHSSLPMSYWGEAFTSAVYIINMLPTPVLHNKSPYQLLFNKVPEYQFLKTFGCACYPMLKPYNTNKLSLRSTLCVFLGYTSNFKGYICKSPTGKTYISRHVVFNEQSFPYKMVSNPFIKHDLVTDSTIYHTSPLTVFKTQPIQHVHDNVTSPEDFNSRIPTFIDNASPHDSLDNPACEQNDIALSPVTSSSATSTEHPEPSPSNNHPMITRSKAGIFKPKAFSVEADNALREPTTVKAALSQPQWFQAMQKEYEALQQNNTWTLVSPPSNATIIGCKWIFRNKFNADGTLQRHKARLVAKGYHQTQGLDYNETFSPVIKFSTVRIILSLALSYKWPIHQIDVNNAFLNGELEETVYMEPPPSFSPPDSNLVCKLNKAIYGLKQAPRSWYLKLANTLTTLGFSSTKSDTSLFIKFSKVATVFVLIYVDDIIITGSSSLAIQNLIKILHTNFALKDLGKLHYFLGIETTWTPEGNLHLSQSKYIRDLLRKTNMTGASPQPTPMISSLRLTQEGSTAISDPTLYRSVVGSLFYITITRPELAFLVNKVCQYMTNPQEHHWKAVKRILRYLAGTINHGLLLRPSKQLTVMGFCDSD